MNKQAIMRLLAALFALALVASACGSDDDSASDDTSATTAAAAESEDAMEDDAMEEEAMEEEAMEEEAMEDESHSTISEECNIPNPADEVEIDLMGWEFPIVTQYAAELEECEDGNYSFNVQFLDSQEARSQILLDISSGSPSFEIVQGSNTAIIEWASTGGLMPLNDLIDTYGAEFGLDQIDPAFFELGSIDGNIYAIPMVSNTMHVFYNEPIMTELGLDVPTTFSEAIAQCGTLQDAGYGGFALMASAGWAWQIEFDNVLGSLGLPNVDPVTGQPNFNSPEGIEAAEILLEMYETCGGSTAGTYSTDDIQAAFQTGEYVVGQTWASRAQAMDDPEASTVVGEIQFAPALGTGSGVLAAPAYMDGYGIPMGVENVEEVFLAIMAATDLESQTAAAEFGFVTRSGVSNDNGPRNGDAVNVSFVDGRGADIAHPAAGIARAKLGEALIQLLDGADPATVLAEAEAAYLQEAGDQGLL